MNYIYYCKGCKTLIASTRTDGRFRCVKCNSLFLPLQISTDSWGTLSEKQRVSYINAAVNDADNPPNRIFPLKTPNNPEQARKFAILRGLHSYIDNLMENGVNVDPPKDGDETVIVPVNCWFDKKVFISLYLLRYHRIVRMRMSYHEMPQLQILVSKNNVELIKQASSLSTLEGGTGGRWEKDMTYIDTYDYLKNNHPIMLWYSSRLNKDVDPLVTNSGLFSNSNVQEIIRYEEWEKDYRDQMYREVIAEYGKMEYPSEYRLFFFVRFLFPDAIYQYHADWLGLQTLDIFIPSINVGVEYQGEQHYKPVDFFGGDEKLELQHDMDVEKKRKCAKQGVKLFEWPYDRWIIETELIKNATIWYPGDASWMTHEFLLNNMEKMCPHTTVDEFLRSIQMRRHEGHISKSRPEKPPKKPLNVYRKYAADGKFIREYPSMSAAAQDNSVSVAAIAKACNGEQKTAAGYMWRIESTDSIIKNIEPVAYAHSDNAFGQSRPIYQVDDDGVIVQRFDSISEASRTVGVDKKSIRMAANGKQKKAAGYHWVFES